MPAENQSYTVIQDKIHSLKDIILRFVKKAMRMPFRLFAFEQTFIKILRLS